MGIRETEGLAEVRSYLSYMTKVSRLIRRAHSQRKTGMIDEALENYKKALRLRPDFPEAREYLGEAYIQAALREIDKLNSYGKKVEEQREDLVKDLNEAAESVK